MSLDWSAIGATATGVAALVTDWMANGTRKAANAGKNTAEASQQMIARAEMELELLGQTDSSICHPSIYVLKGTSVSGHANSCTGFAISKNMVYMK